MRALVEIYQPVSLTKAQTVSLCGWGKGARRQGSEGGAYLQEERLYQEGWTCLQKVLIGSQPEKTQRESYQQESECCWACFKMLDCENIPSSISTM